MTIQRELATFVVEAKPPAQIVQKMRMRLLDTFAAALPNAREPFAERLMRAHGGETGAISVWGRTERLQPIRAAFINGTLAHGSDYDDTQGESGLHGSGIVSAATLACAEELGSSGDEMVAAFAVGIESAVRIAGAVDQEINRRGFHTTPVVGVFGAMAACCRLMKLSSAQVADAFGLCGSIGAGLRQFLITGGDVKRIHGGWAAQGGFQSALWAKHGITGPDAVIEGPYGFYQAHLGHDVEPARVLDGLGTQWRSASVMAKRYPCCHYLQALADAALTVRPGALGKGVERAVALIPPQGIGVVCEPDEVKRHPSDPYAAKFSAQYVLASTMIDGRLGPDSFTPEAIARADIRAYTDRVGFRTHEFASDGPFTYPGGVELQLQNGEVIRELLDAPLPMNRAAIEAKLADGARLAGLADRPIVEAIDSALPARDLIATLVPK